MKCLFALFFAFFLTHASDLKAATTQMRPAPIFLAGGLSMHPGEVKISQNGQYSLAFQKDSNLVIYNIQHPLWATDTVGKGATLLVFQGDGNLVLYRNSTPLWSSNTAGNPSAVLNFQTDGNLVIYKNSSGPELWSTHTSSGIETPAAVKVITTGVSAASQLVIPDFATSDNVIADYDASEQFGADPSGATDSSSAIQSALNACKNDGGGTVWLPHGNYRVSSTITIPDFCTLRGDWHPLSGSPAGETIIHASVAPASSTGVGGASVFSVGGSASLMGVVIYYPEQNINSVVPYNYAIEVPIAEGGGYMSSSIQNVTLLNAYRGIAISPNWTSAHEESTIQNVEGTVLNTGIFSTNSADVDVYENINFGPQFWASAGAEFNAPAEAPIASYTLSNATAFLLGDLEWSQFLNLTATDFLIGIHTVKGTRIHFIGEFVNAQITGSRTAVQIDDVDTRFTSGATFSGGTLSGSAHSILNNSSGLSTFDHVVISGATAGKVAITDTPVDEPNNPVLPPIYAEPGVQFIPKANSSNFINVAANPYNVVRVHQNGNGVIPSFDTDATAGIQAALNQAGTMGGGVVYVPAGWYYLGGRLTVPANVELRGSSSSPTRNQGGLSGGTVLFTTVGEGSQTALTDQAFITLDGTAAGVSGLVIFYPDNNFGYTFDQVYPYAIRGKGASTYAKNIGLTNGVYGLDFATNANPNHWIERVVGLANHYLIDAGNGAGTIRNILSNPNSATRSGFGLQRWPTEGSSTFTNLINTNRSRLHLIRIFGNNSSTEQLVNIFSYGSCYEIENRNPNVNVFNAGSDNLGNGYTIWSREAITVQNVLRYNGLGSTFGVAPNGGITLFNDSWIKGIF